MKLMEPTVIELDMEPYDKGDVRLYEKPVWLFGGKFYTTRYRAFFAKAKNELYLEEFEKWKAAGSPGLFRKWVKHNWTEYEYSDWHHKEFAYNDPVAWTARIHKRAKQLMEAL